MGRRVIILALALLLVTAPLLVLAAPLAPVTQSPTRTPAPAPTEAAAEAVLETTIPLYAPEVIARYDHDPNAFTQGLVWQDGTMYESAGRYGQSELREVDLDTGEVVRSVPVDDAYFAEGLALVEDRLIQITWQEFTAFQYDLETFEVVGEFTYEGEGWGLCFDGDVLWMSDGSPNLFQRDPETFELLDTIPVTLFDQPVPQLNELECVDGRVYANVWQSDFIVRIVPETGLIDGVIDARALLTAQERAGLVSNAVLNGIAYRPETDTFLITGKLWPTLFEVTFVEVGELQPR